MQTLPSSVHAVLFGFTASPGHAAAEPVQLSARSHSPAADRQRVVEGTKTFAGQSSSEPSHASATSQTPAPERQTVPDATFASAGQTPDEPVQLSSTSQTPAAERQTVDADWKTSTHTLFEPVQWSAASSLHAPPCEAPVQLVDADWNTFAGHAPLDPVQVSATSH